MTQMIVYLIFLGVLILCAVCDLRTREVPLPVQGAAFVFLLVWQVIGGTEGIMHYAAAAVLFVVMLIGVRFFTLGGADAVAGSLIGLALGMYGILAVMAAFIAAVPYLIIRLARGDRRPDYAFVPYLAGGYAAVLIWMFATGIA